MIRNPQKKRSVAFPGASGIRKDERGEAGLLLSSLFFLFLMFLCFTVTISIWNLLQTKMRLNTAADRITRYIEHEGRIDTADDSAVTDLGTELLSETGAERMEVTVTYPSGKNATDGNELIQLCNPFTVTLTADVSTGSFLFDDLFRYRNNAGSVTFTVTEGSISEQYWEDLVEVSDAAVFTWTWTD